MKERNHYVAVDLGASNGRVMLATIEGEMLSIQEIHRFVNGPIEKAGAIHWDFDALMREIKAGIKKAAALGHDILSIGIDTWGVDYGLIDGNGKLLEMPYHYRDSRTNGMVEKACEVMPREQIYANTGIQFMPLNTLFQLIACKEQRPELLEKTAHMLLMPSLIMYFLTGEISAEYTMASTTQMLDMRTGEWSRAIIDAFGLSERILPDIIKPGKEVGRLTKEVAVELGCGQIPVIAVGTHDTASAVAAVPVDHNRSWAYLSSGTWSLQGIEIPNPVIDDTTCELSFTNEGGVENTIRLLKNIMGLWLVQECRREWAGEGEDFDYAQLTKMAGEAKPFQAILDTDYGDFLAPGQMPQKINRYLQSTGQAEIRSKGEMIRAVLESLAYRYCNVIERLESLSAQSIDVLHIVGGGIKNQLLNQLTADATGKEIVAGPTEATVMGNVLVQALAVGQIGSISEGRVMVANSIESKKYLPRDTGAWRIFAEKAESVLS